MNKIVDLLIGLFGMEKEEILLYDRIEFRVNKKEKELIKKYCELKHIDISKFFRSLAMKEIDNFIKYNS